MLWYSVVHAESNSAGPNACANLGWLDIPHADVSILDATPSRPDTSVRLTMADSPRISQNGKARQRTWQHLSIFLQAFLRCLVRHRRGLSLAQRVAIASPSPKNQCPISKARLTCTTRQWESCLIMSSNVIPGLESAVCSFRTYPKMLCSGTCVRGCVDEWVGRIGALRNASCAHVRHPVLRVLTFPLHASGSHEDPKGGVPRFDQGL